MVMELVIGAGKETDEGLTLDGAETDLMNPTMVCKSVEICVTSVGKSASIFLTSAATVASVEVKQVEHFEPMIVKRMDIYIDTKK